MTRSAHIATALLLVLLAADPTLSFHVGKSPASKFGLSTAATTLSHPSSSPLSPFYSTFQQEAAIGGMPVSFSAISSAKHSQTSSSTAKSTAKKTDGQPKSNTNGNRKKKNGNKGNSKKNNSRGNRSQKRQMPGQERPPRREESKPRTVLFDYDANCNPLTNERRLREPINCEHFERNECSGCSINENVGTVSVIDSAKMYFSSTSIRQKFESYDGYDDFDDESANDENFKVVVPSAITEWRTQAKLAVAPRSSSWGRDGCIFGLYKRGSHRVSPIPNCQVHHPAINRAVDALSNSTVAVGTPAYSRQNADGGLRYVQLQVERTTGKICLSLVWAVPDLKGAQPSLSRLVKELLRREPDLFHSIWCHCNDNIGNTIFSRDSRSWHRIKGPEFLREPLPTTDMGWLHFSPLTFRQGNLDGFDVLATDVANAIPGGSKVCELYAGVGSLGIAALAHHAKPGKTPLTWVRSSDENPSNQRCFTRTMSSLPASIAKYESVASNDAKNLDEEPMTLGQLAQMMESGKNLDVDSRSGFRAKYMVADASNALTAGQALGASVLVVDPPRKGLEPEVLAELCKPMNPEQPYVEFPNMLNIPDDRVNWTNDIERLIYVSCGFDALARDCDALLSSQAGWKIESATGYILFPGSDHVETVCIFNRR